VRLPSTVKYADDNVKAAFLVLKGDLLHQLTKAFFEISINAFSGVQIPKRLIPLDYRRWGIPNLWKRNLPNGWRLLYFIVEINSEAYSVVLDWLPHKEYERKFNY
jgi:hypothetical protein